MSQLSCSSVSLKYSSVTDRSCCWSVVVVFTPIWPCLTWSVSLPNKPFLTADLYTVTVNLCPHVRNKPAPLSISMVVFFFFKADADKNLFSTEAAIAKNSSYFIISKLDSFQIIYNIQWNPHNVVKPPKQHARKDKVAWSTQGKSVFRHILSSMPLFFLSMLLCFGFEQAKLTM